MPKIKEHSRAISRSKRKVVIHIAVIVSIVISFLSFVNPNLSSFARNYNFSSRVVSLPQHSIIGYILDSRFLSSTQQEIYSQLSTLDFWNNLNFEDYNLDPQPNAPFRSIVLGEIKTLSSNRYQVQIELDGFDSISVLDIVFLYEDEDISILLIRNLI